MNCVITSTIIVMKTYQCVYSSYFIIEHNFAHMVVDIQIHQVYTRWNGPKSIIK